MQPITQGQFRCLPLSALSSLLLTALAHPTVLATSPSAPLYSITGINGGLSVSGALDTTATGINSTGDVVGSIGLGQGERLAYVWFDGNLNGKVDQNEIRWLPSTLGGRGSGAEAINDSGQIVGYAMNWWGDSRAALWNGNTQSIDLGTLGGESSSAADINNKGQIVGTAQNSSGSDRGFIISPPAQALTPAICPNNYVLSEVVAINDSGVWVGSCFKQSGSIYLALLPIFGSSLSKSAYTDINNNGLIAGNAVLTNGLAGFVYDPTNPAGSLTLLQPNVGGKILNSTEVKALNDRGAIVGSAGSVSRVSTEFSSSVYSPEYAALWTDPNAPITNLNNQLNSACNWNLKEATDINNNGQIIGNGTHNGIAQGFRLNPFTGFDLKLGGGLLEVEIDEGQTAELNLESWAPGDCTPLTNSTITYTGTTPGGALPPGTGGITYTTLLPGLTDKQTNTVTVTAEAQTSGQTFSSSLFSTIVKVRNVAPTIDQITFNNQVVAASNPNVTIEVGKLFDLGIVARDPGLQDILSSNWSSPAGSNVLSMNPSGSWQVNTPGTHHSSSSWQFNTPGIYHLLATAMDDDGGKSDPRSITVTVTAVAVPEPTTIGGLLVAGAIGAQLRRQAARRKKI